MHSAHDVRLGASRGKASAISNAPARAHSHFYLDLFIITLALLLALAGAAVPARGDSPPGPSVESAARDLLHNNQPSAILHVIVQTDPQSLGTSAPIAAAARLVHGSIRGVAPAGGFIAADVSPAEAVALSHQAGVRHVSFDWPVHSTSMSGSVRAGFSLGADVTEAYAPAAWQSGLFGNNIGVAIVDSGIASHPDLRGWGLNGQRVIAWKDFVGGQSVPYDDYGHGTNVAGIAAGDGLMSLSYNTRFPGVAPGINLIGVKVLDSTGAGTVSTVIEGIDWCIQNAAKYNIRIINLSLGHPVYESYTVDPLNQEVEKAWQAGIVVVVAAGNDGRLNAAPTAGVTDNYGYGTCYGSIECPGNDPDVITVGAMKAVDSSRSDDCIASYSSRGPTLGDDLLKPDISAYGNLTVSLYAKNGALEDTYPQNDVEPSQYHGIGPIEYFVLSGTSMSTPVVAGAAALMLEADPQLTPDTIKLRLMLSADKWDGDALTYGSGYLDIPAALSNTAVATAPMFSPQLIQGPNGLVIISDPAGSPEAVYGNAALWGGGAIISSDDLASSGTVWSDSALWGGSAVWGDSAIWGKSTLDATIFGDGGDTL